MKIKDMILVALFAAIIVVLAIIPPIPVPFSPVPITLQTLGVFLAATMLGSKLGSLAVLIYVLLGTFGLPVFAGGASGFGVLVGPTGGYLIGFIIGAFVIGFLMEKGPFKGIVRDVVSMVCGLVVIYVIGTIWLSVVTEMPLQKALLVGSLPYIPLDIVKLTLAVLLAKPVKQRILINA